MPANSFKLDGQHGLSTDHPIMIHCFHGKLEEARAWKNKWTGTLFSFNVHFCKPEALSVAARLPLSAVSVESDCPYLGKDPMTTKGLIAKIAALREENVPTLKSAILSNLLTFLQPTVGCETIWPKVFELAKTYSRKPTDMSVVDRHVRHFTNTKPQLKWAESDLQNY